MVLPFTLPDWVPWWVNLVILLPALLFALAFLFMPFSVIGVKARLEGIEARLDDLQAELRTLSLRLADGAPGARSGAYVDEEATHPPIVPAIPAWAMRERTSERPVERPVERPGERHAAPRPERALRGERTPRERTEPRLG